MFGGVFLFRRYSIFYRLFVSFVIIATIPVSTLFILLYNNSIVTMRSEVENFNISNLYQIRDNLDLRFRECKSIAAQISLIPS